MLTIQNGSRRIRAIKGLLLTAATITTTALIPASAAQAAPDSRPTAISHGSYDDFLAKASEFQAKARQRGDMSLLTCDDVVIKARATGKYVIVEEHYTGDRHDMLRARQADRNAATVFNDCVDANGYHSFQVYTTGYVRADISLTGAYDGMLRGNGTGGGSSYSEHFTLGNSGNYKTILSRTANKYVATEVSYAGGDDGMLRARSSSAGTTAEEYTIEMWP